MVEPVTAILSGIALVKSATSFIKDNINTVNDISDIAKQIDQMFEGQQQIHKERNKQANSTANELGLSSVATSIIESKLADERISEIRTLINYRFPTSKPPSTWDLIIMERKTKNIKKTSRNRRVCKIRIYNYSNNIIFSSCYRCYS